MCRLKHKQRRSSNDAVEWVGKGWNNNFFGGIFLAKNENSLSSSINAILSLKPDKEDEERLFKKGVPKRKINNGTVIMESLVNKAAKGEVSAIKEVLAILENGDNAARSDISMLYTALDDED